MKTFLTVAVLGLTGLAGVAGAEAQDLRSYRNESRRDARHAPRHERNKNFWRHGRDRERAPRVERYYVPARYATVIAGYDHCGQPIYRTVCVSQGHWATRHCD